MQVASAVLGPIALIRQIGSGEDLLPDSLGAAEFSVANGAGALQAGNEIGPITVDCLVDGTVTLSVSIADENLEYLRAGDYFSLTFSDCDNDIGILVDGGVDIEVLSDIAFSPDFEFEPPYRFEVEVDFSGLSITELESSYTITGGFTLTESTEDGVVFATDIKGDTLSILLDGLREDLRNFLIVGTLDLGVDAFTVEVRCQGEVCTRLDSYSLGGWVEFESISPFVGSGDDSPLDGEMEVTGGVASNGTGPSQLLIRALDYTCVELVVDELGDGNEEDWRTTWESLPTGVAEDCDGLD